MTDLSDRIANSLATASCPNAVEIAALVAETEAALIEAKATRDAARVAALDPRTPANLVLTLRGEVGEADWTIDRLAVALDRLKVGHKAATIKGT